MKKNVIWPNNTDEDSTYSSINSTYIPSCHEISRLAGLTWRGYSNEFKEEWSMKASMLNNRPQNDGKFTEIPSWVLTFSIEEAVKMSLSQEWLNLVQVLRNAVVVKRNPMVTYKKVYTFGNEKVKLDLQIIRKFSISHLLLITIFGSPLFCKQLPHEIVYRTKKEAVVHIHSHRRFSEMLKFGGIDGSNFLNKGIKIHICPKVCLKDNRGRSIIGYVMDEKENLLGVRLEGISGELAWVQAVKYDSNLHLYLYDDGHNYSAQNTDIYSISYYWPIRIKLNVVTGHSYLIMSKYTCSLEEIGM